MGIGGLSYPSISNYLFEKNGTKVIDGYRQEVLQLDTSAIDAAWEEAERYNQDLTGSPVHDPFLEGSGMAMPEVYHQVLSVGGVMGYVDIPIINVYLPIFHGTSEKSLQNGVGHLEGSTLPIGGSTRHSVLTGHCGLSNATLFTNLIELKEGDLFFIHVLDQTLAYKVDQIKVIEPSNTDDLRRVDDGDYCTLLTCTPYGINSHRLLVRGVRVSYSPEAYDAIEPITSTSNDIMVIRAAVITACVMLVMILMTYVYNRRRLEGTRRVAMRPRPEGRRARPPRPDDRR
jgi:sortase A